MKRPLKPLRRIGALVAVLLLLVAADAVLYPRLARPAGPSGDTGRNGLWLRYTWYFGQYGWGDLHALEMRLREHRIRDAYFHVRYIQRDGSLRFRYPRQARRLVAAVHRDAPGVRCYAWVYAGNRRGRGAVDLSSATVRHRMAQEAAWLVTECGFDGVQWDYEICPDGDQGFLALLRETRAALPRGKLLSVATPLWIPWPVGPNGWREGMFQQVAASCDQLAVMAYDSTLYLPRAYTWLVEQQVTHVTRAAARGNPACRITIGVPTYAKGGWSHDPHTENLRMALLGVRKGLANPSTARSTFDGVALFADYTTQLDEWVTYDRDWVVR